MEKEINEEEADFVESVGLKATNYNNMVDRYFTKYYIDRDTDKEQYIFVHTNGLIMCGLGANNIIVRNKIKEVTDLNKVQKVSGKRKHGAHILNENESIIRFTLEMEDKSEKTINYSPKVKGKLLEINSKIFDKHTLINEYPEKYGFICFILIDPRAINGFKEHLDNNCSR